MLAFYRAILRHRVAVLLFIVAVSAVSLWSVQRAVVASSVGKLFLGDSPAYLRYQELTRTFGNDEVLLVALDEPDLLGPHKQARLRRVIDVVRALPDVDYVASPLDLVAMERGGSGLIMQPYAERALEDPASALRMAEQLASDPLGEGLLVGSDGSWMVLVALSQEPSRPAEVAIEVVPAVLAAFAAEGWPRDTVRIGGLLATLEQILQMSMQNLTVLLPITALTLLLTVWLLFRRLWPATVALAVSGIGVLWTMGFAVQLDREVNILMAVAPAVILIVGFSDVVHLISAYLLEIEDGKEREAAIYASAADVGRACLFTSMTTFVGFFSLTFVPTPVFRTLGMILGFGVATALLLAMVGVPIVLSYLPLPKPLRGGQTAVAQRVLDRVLEGLQAASVRRPWLVLGGFFVFTAVMAAGALQLTIETDFAKRLEPDNPVRVDSSWIGERFAGLNLVGLYIDAGETDGLLDPARLLDLAELQAELVADRPEVDSARSIVDVFARTHLALTGQPGMPSTRAEVAQELLLLEMEGPGTLDRAMDFDRRQAAVSLRLGPEGFRTSSDAALRVAERAREALPWATVDVTSMTFLLGDWLDEIVAGQRRGLGVSALVIALMMGFGLRSARIGALSMVPNLLPLLAVVGWVGGTWPRADSDFLIVCLLALGIGVDDTIHFLMRFRLECERVDDRQEALHRTFAFAGRAIVMTTVILVVGFLPFAFSGYFTIKTLGTLLPACLIVALFADLLMVPAMARVGWLALGRAK